MMKTRGPFAGLILATAALLPAAEPGDVNSGEKAAAISAIQPVSLNLAAGLSEKDETKKEASKSDAAQPAAKESSEKKQGSTSEKAEKKADSKATKDASKNEEASKDKPKKRKPLKRKVLVVKATWCGACQALNYEWPKLRKVRWRIGGANTDHFQLIDVDANPDVVGRYGITQLPTLLLIENGKVIQRAGGLNAKDLAEFYYGRL